MRPVGGLPAVGLCRSVPLQSCSTPCQTNPTGLLPLPEKKIRVISSQTWVMIRLKPSTAEDRICPHAFCCGRRRGPFYPGCSFLLVADFLPLLVANGGFWAQEKKQWRGSTVATATWPGL